MNKLILALRAIVFYLGYSTAICLFSLLGITVGYLMPYKARQTLLTTANHFAVLWLRVCCRVKLDIRGIDTLPTNSPFVALSKHQSSFETLYLQRKLRPVSTILKKELLAIPVFGWGLAATRPIAIDRSNPKQALREVLIQGMERLGQGNNVIVYPEGTRIDYGKQGSYSRSGAALAIDAGVPIVPVAHNAGKFWPAHKLVKYPGTITLVFGAPIPTQGRKSKELIAEIETWIEENVTKL